MSYAIVRDGVATLSSRPTRPLAFQSADSPPVRNAGFYRYRSAEPYPDYWNATMWHLCAICARKNINTELRPDKVHFHLLEAHGVDLDEYIAENYGRTPDFDGTIAQWREP